MTVGIHMRYQSGENAWVALQIATWLRTQGRAYSVLALGSQALGVHPDWDHHIHSDTKINFAEWAKKCSHVVWVNDVSIQDILQVKKHKVKTVLVASWNDPIGHLALYNLVDCVVCVSPLLFKKLKSVFNLENLIYVPLDVTMLKPRQPILIRPNRPKLLLHLKGPRKHRLGTVLSSVIKKWFATLPAEWTLWVPKELQYKKSWLSRCLKTTHADSSFTFETKSDWNSQILLYGWNDATIWPTLYPGHGLTVLLSLAMGSPVVTFDVPPASEYLSRSNGLMAPTTLRHNEDGTAQLVPDLTKYDQLVTAICRNPNKLIKLRNHTMDWMVERSKLFNEGWSSILN